MLRFIEAQDRFARPILIIRARYITSLSADDLKSNIITMYELGRLHLAHLYSKSRDVIGASSSLERVLQFVIIADLEGLGIRSVVGQTFVTCVPDLEIVSNC